MQAPKPSDAAPTLPTSTANADAPPVAPAARPALLPRGALRVYIKFSVVFVLLVIVCLAVAYWNLGSVITYLQLRHIRTVVETSRISAEQSAKVEQVLQDYDRARSERDYWPWQWKHVGERFAETPAVSVLGFLEARAWLPNLQGASPPQIERGQQNLDRLLRGIAEGSVSRVDLSTIVTDAQNGGPQSGVQGRSPTPEELTAEKLRLFNELAEKLIATKNLPPGPYEPDLAVLLRRDLWASLEAGNPEAPAPK